MPKKEDDYMDKIEFQDKLQNLWITDYESDKVCIEKIDSISENVMELVPEKLYRFRSCSKYALQELKNYEIWGTKASLFNDSMECMPTYDLSTVSQIIKEAFDINKIQDQLEMLKNKDFPDIITKIFTNDTLGIFCKNIPNDNTCEVVESLKLIIPEIERISFDILNENLDEDTDNFFRQAFDFRNQTYVSCFSENLYSPLMWGHYTRSHSGFAIEYELKNTIKKCSKSCGKYCNFFHLNYQLAPVGYDKNRYDASVYLSQILESKLACKLNIPMQYIIDRDRFRVPKTILRKSLEWEYEQEWRLFQFDEKCHSNYRKMATIKPSAVYLGTNISSWYKSRIIKLCQEQQIPCYRMLNSYISKEFKLIVDEGNPLT